MKFSKPLLVGAAVIGSIVMGSGMVFASNTNSGSSLVDQIATRFHLNRADVQQVFDQQKSQKIASQQQWYKQMLSNAVTNGKLTSAQRDKILTKHNEILAKLQSLRQNDQKVTPAQRRAAMQKLRAEIAQWEKENSIPPGYLLGHGSSRHGLDGRPLL